MRVQSRSVPAVLTAAVLTGAGMLLGWSPQASAEPCSDVEVVFARGTTERPGAGSVGNAFTEALRSQVGDKTVGLSPVSYPANHDWPTAVIGVNDAANRIRQLAADCPDTKVVLGGFSQGAAVAQLVTADPRRSRRTRSRSAPRRHWRRTSPATSTPWSCSANPTTDSSS